MIDSKSVIAKIEENICCIKEFGVNRIGLFGSFSRNEQDDNSDIDIIVDYKKGYVNLDNYMGLKYFLEDLFDKKVDLVRSSILKPKVRKNVMESVIYVKGT